MLSDSSCISGIHSNPLDLFLEAWEQCSAQPGMFGAKAPLSPLLEGLSRRSPGQGRLGSWEPGRHLGAAYRQDAPRRPVAATATLGVHR